MKTGSAADRFIRRAIAVEDIVHSIRSMGLPWRWYLAVASYELLISCNVS